MSTKLPPNTVSRLSLFSVDPMWVSIGTPKVAKHAAIEVAWSSPNRRAAHHASSGRGITSKALAKRSRAISRSSDPGPPRTRRSTFSTWAMSS